jgi:hypothetical protein
MNNNAFSFTLRDQDHPYPEPPQFPSLLGKHVVLRPVTPNDYPMLQAVETEGDLAGRWRWRGMTPSPEQWVSQLWNGVLAQFIMVARSSGEPLALIYAYKASQRDGTAYLAVLKFNPNSRSTLVMAGTALFVEYLFTHWDLRTVYMEVPAFNMSQFASGIGRYFAIEGQLRDNYVCCGKRYDMYILAIHVEQWKAASRNVIAAELARPPKVTVTLPGAREEQLVTP